MHQTLNRRHVFSMAMIGLLLSGCVKKKLFTSELVARKSAEAQVSVLAREVFDRKREATVLINQNGELNKQIGMLQKEVTDLQGELAKRTQMMGASSEKLLTEKRDLEERLFSLSARVEVAEKKLEDFRNATQQRKATLQSESEALAAAVGTYIGSGVEIRLEANHLVMTVADQLLFEKEGVRPSVYAQTVLSGLATFLAERPAYAVQINAHVDNQLPPKNREITDSWSFSLARAVQVVRTLVQLNVNAYMLSPVAKGEFQPLTTNSTPEGRQENRRTEIILIPKLPSLPTGM